MSDQISASHILVSHTDAEGEPSSRSRDEAEEKVKAIAERLAGGEDFADAAKSDSDCPSASKGGDLGRFGEGAMVKPFDDAAFALDIDETSGIVETIFGFHLIRRTG